jgi:hypothetical protein
MPIPTTTPPQDPIRVEVVTYDEATKAYTMKIAGSVGHIVTESTSPLKDVANALRAASVDLSTHVSIHSPSHTPLYNGQLVDLPTS